MSERRKNGPSRSGSLGGGPSRGGSSRRSNNKRNPSQRRSNGGSNRQGRRSGGKRPYQKSGGFYLKRGTVVYILDILQHGGIDQPHHSWNPICQCLEVPNYRFLEAELNKGEIPRVQEKIVIKGKEDAIGKIQRVLKYDDLTMTSKELLSLILQDYIKENEMKFVNFFNKAGPITIKRHSLEILPGVGKKLMWEIIQAREKKPFESFEDIKERILGFKPEEIIAKRIEEEIENADLKHYLFVNRKLLLKTNNSRTDGERPYRNRDRNYDRNRNRNYDRNRDTNPHREKWLR